MNSARALFYGLLIGLFCLFFVSCSTGPGNFVQGSIRIALPVHQERAVDGSIVFGSFNDGGTTMIKIKDAEGRDYVVYLDHRLSVAEGNTFTKVLGDAYLNAYPGNVASVRVIDQIGFRRKVLGKMILPENILTEK